MTFNQVRLADMNQIERIFLSTDSGQGRKNGQDIHCPRSP